LQFKRKKAWKTKPFGKKAKNILLFGEIGKFSVKIFANIPEIVF
jgi:hypothetical protein